MRISTRSATPGVGDELAGQLGLRRRERDPGDADAVLARGVDREAAPAAADVEHALAGAAARASARSGRAWRAGPPRASARRARTARSCRSSTRRGTARRSRCRRRSGSGSPRASRSGLWRAPGSRSSVEGRRGIPAGSAASASAPSSRALSRARDRRRHPVVDDQERAVDVVGLERPLDVGAAEPERPRRAQRVRDRRGAADEEGRRVRRRSRARVRRPRTRSRTGAREAPARARGRAAPWDGRAAPAGSLRARRVRAPAGPRGRAPGGLRGRAPGGLRGRAPRIASARGRRTRPADLLRGALRRGLAACGGARRRRHRVRRVADGLSPPARHARHQGGRRRPDRRHLGGRAARDGARRRPPRALRPPALAACRAPRADRPARASERPDGEPGACARPLRSGADAEPATLRAIGAAALAAATPGPTACWRACSRCCIAAAGPTSGS